MHLYQLARVYEDLRAAQRAGDRHAMRHGLTTALGIDLPEPGALNAEQDTEAGLTYRGFKPVELAMLAANRKPVVKFEDIPLPQARRFVSAYKDVYRLHLSAPYRKDYLLLRSRPTERADKQALVSIYAARDDAGEQLHALERANPADIRGAGALLGFPTCCIEAFAADFERSRSDQDTVNDDACARLLASVPNGTGHPALDPFSDRELLGFYPCRLDCEAAIAFARANAQALMTSSPRDAADAQAALGRPIRFWRLPFFVRFSADRTHINRFPDRTVAAIQAQFGRHILPIARQDGSAAAVRFAPWPANFFDPLYRAEQHS